MSFVIAVGNAFSIRGGPVFPFHVTTVRFSVQGDCTAPQSRPFWHRPPFCFMYYTCLFTLIGSRALNDASARLEKLLLESGEIIYSLLSFPFGPNILPRSQEAILCICLREGHWQPVEAGAACDKSAACRATCAALKSFSPLTSTLSVVGKQCRP